MSFLSSIFGGRKGSAFNSATEIQDALGASVLTEIDAPKSKKGDDKALLLSGGAPALQEAYKRLIQQFPKTKISTMLVVGATAADRSDLITADLAIALGSQGKKVIAVDCDFANPSLHKRFGVENKVGIAEMLGGSAKISDTLVNTSAKNVSLITAGSTDAPATLLASGEISKLVSSLGFNADLILINVPPFSEKFDVSKVVENVKNTLFVYQLGHTKKTAAQDSIDTLKASHANIIGIVSIGGGKKIMADKPETKKTKAAPAKKSSSGFGEAKTYAIILVIGILIISLLGVGAWYLIVQKFSQIPEDVVARTEQPAKTPEAEKEDSGGIFGFGGDTDKEDKEEQPEAQPEQAQPASTSDAGPSGPFGVKSNQATQTPDQTPAGTQAEVLEKTEAAVDTEETPVDKVPTSTKRPPQNAVASTSSDTDSGTPTATSTEPRQPEATTTREPEPQPETTSRQPQPTLSTSTSSSTSTATQPTRTATSSTSSTDYPRIGRMPYSVLVHSFTDRQGDSGLLRARKASIRLNEQGYGAYWTKAEIDGKTWYRVLIGVFPSASEAAAAARNVANDLNSETTVLSLPYAVELGWQPSVSMANAVERQVERFQYSTYRIVIEKDGQNWVLLRTGAFSSEAEAKELLKYLNSDGFKGQVVRR